VRSLNTENTTMPERLITIAEASRKTGIAYHCLRRLALSGRVPTVDVAGLRRIRLSAVLSIMSELGAEV